MLSEFKVKLICSVFLANNIIQRRIYDMSANIEVKLFIRLSMSDTFELHLDKSKNIAKKYKE